MNYIFLLLTFFFIALSFFIGFQEAVLFLTCIYLSSALLQMELEVAVCLTENSVATVSARSTLC